MTHYCQGAIEEGPQQACIRVRASLKLKAADHLRVLNTVKEPQWPIAWDQIAEPVRIRSIWDL